MKLAILCSRYAVRMTVSLRATSLLIGLSIAAVALTGCAPSAEPTPSQTSSPTTQPSTPTTEESPAPAAAASIVFSASTLQIIDSAGVTMSEHNYFEPTAGVVDVLTEAFGSEPIVADYDSRADSPGGTSYDWGGFELRDGEWNTEAPYYTEFNVFVTAATVGGLALSTNDGVSVGDSFSAVAAANPDHVESDAGGPLSLDWTELPMFPDGYGVDVVPSLAVLVVDSEQNDVVSRLIAPVMNWGA